MSRANNLVGKRPTRFAVVRYRQRRRLAAGRLCRSLKKLIASGSKELPITDDKMTRFWITQEEAIIFVIKSLQRMQGGEIFVPKIPSIRIVELARAMAPKLAQKIVGIRPGEKLHEVMCPNEDSVNTIEFTDHFVITPSIRFIVTADYRKNGLGETGQPVQQGFEYNSANNPHFIEPAELTQLYG